MASNSDGVIDPVNHYAWGENVGWIDFGTTEGNVHVTDTLLSGYAYGENIGWVSLDTVSNSASGVLSGYAWSENVGWIDFAPAGGGVTINKDGVFSGNAFGENIGWITFGTTSSNKVQTDWRYESIRNPSVPPSSGSHSHGSSGGGYKFFNNFSQTVTQPVANVITAVTNIPNAIKSIGDAISNIIPEFLKPTSGMTPSSEPQFPTVSQKVPLAMSAKWNILPVKAIGSFVFAPLPSQIKSLATKFPQLNSLFQKVGVEKMSDVSKLNGVTLNVPGLSSLTEKLLTNTGVGKIALTGGLPVSKFTPAEKKSVPSEIIFARTQNEQVDLGVTMSVDDKGAVSQSVSTFQGKNMRLVVKPLAVAKSVTGYFTYKAPTPNVSRAQGKVPRSTFTASALFAVLGLSEKAPAPVPVEQKLVLSSFEYTDPDHDGIYTADVVAPSVVGNYDVITVIDYVDPALGLRQMRLTTVVDPEGYVYEKNGDKETRIPKAIVSIYQMNNATGKYDLWPAKDYQQTNPQTTNVSGNYSFLVPEGAYYIGVMAPGYKLYQGEVFNVVEGSGVHQNIELQPNSNWTSVFDWKTSITIVTFLLLIFVIIRSYKRT